MKTVTFNGLSFATDPGRVMVPREASEQLVASAVECIGTRSARVVDVGAGSGAIAVAIAAAAPNAHVVAVDNSRAAVALARVNIYRHGLRDRVSAVHGDLLDAVRGPIDVVVANLPYLPAADADSYPDLDGEPSEAVFSPGDGLDPYRSLLSACSERLDGDAAVFIQLHRRVLAGTRADLHILRARIESFAPVPRLAAA